MRFNKHIATIDSHTAGEPLRIILSGFPPIKGETMLEKRKFAQTHLDEFRKVLMFEPRGHHGMYGCIVTPPVSAEAEFGVLFMHNEGFSTMCGHGIIAVVTALLETGQLSRDKVEKPLIIDSPAGKITAHVELEQDEVRAVSFENVPSFVYAEDVQLEWEGRRFSVSIAYGGAFYAIVEAKDLGLKVDIPSLPTIQEWGWQIKQQIEAKMKVQHPFEPEIQGIYGVIFSDQPELETSDLKNVTIFAEKQVDRSPCGTGTSARLATLYQQGKLQIGERFVHEGIVNGQFTSDILRTTKVGSYEAIVPRIGGRGFITGLHQFFVDPSDPLGAGFLLQ